ncbi:hypothetical protein EDB83DRAFT_2312131 [Lactarius deliciosus]|nr:hypothetical protein EDB83DRAFT_2312131 [Lactarius deliciosus]
MSKNWYQTRDLARNGNSLARLGASSHQPEAHIRNQFWTEFGEAPPPLILILQEFKIMTVFANRGGDVEAQSGKSEVQRKIGILLEVIREREKQKAMAKLDRQLVHSTNALWSLHVKEATSDDGSRIQSLKDDIDGVLMFVSNAGFSRLVYSPLPSLPVSSTNSKVFNPSSSDIRVNVYWFMSLVFCLSASLLATLVQQWVRDYIHPLKSGDYASIYMKV